MKPNRRTEFAVRTRSQWTGLLCLLALLAVAITSKGAEAVPGGTTPSTTNALSGVPAEGRILKIIHGWPDGPGDQDGLIRTLTAQGFGGVVCNVSFTDYLESEPRWDALARAVRAAKQAGFAMWLYDERGYPSAAAGGIVLRGHPEWQARGLLIADEEVEGQTAALESPPGRQVLAAAYPVRGEEINSRGGTNLAALVKDGKLLWQPPPGRWRVMMVTESPLFEGTHVSVSLGDHIPYPNLLEREPIARFLEVTHEGYARHLGSDLGKWFISTFTDEPSLMSLFLKRMPWRVLPWSPGLPGEFKRRRGYDLEPILPALITEAGAEGRRARYDFWRTIGELVSENYFGQITDWCEQHHLRSGGHLLMEENPVNQVGLYGDFFGCLRRMSAPGIDCLTSLPPDVPWYIARLAGSAADLEGHAVTMCETSDHVQRYRPAGDKRPVRTVTPAEIRGTCNRLIVSGINTINSYYTFTGLNEARLRELNGWVGRCCAALQGGSQVADIAVLYPTESLWPRFLPSKYYTSDAGAAARIENIYHNVIESLFSAGRDFTFVDGRTLAEAKVEAGALVYRGFRWRVVVLPGADTLPMAAWEKLGKFVESGGVVAAIGALPANSESEFPSPRVQGLGARIFGPGGEEPRAHAVSAGGGGLLVSPSMVPAIPAMLDRILEPDLKANGANSPLRYTHRRIAGQEVYFVINDSAAPWTGSVSLCAFGAGEWRDPGTGEAHAVADPARIPLSLPEYGGALFQFASARLPKRSPLETGPASPFHGQNLPDAKPTEGHGEFVRGELVPDTDHSAPGRPAWRATATLTRSAVDTHLMTRFGYDHGIDLRQAASLLLDTWTPPGQRSPAELLVILHDKSGADYLANTGRWLGTAGQEQTCVELSRFQLAGWSHDDKGHLDLANITAVIVGWGGYFGTEGEQVRFSVALPQIVPR